MVDRRFSVRRGARVTVDFTARRPVAVTAQGSATEQLADGSGEVSVTATATRAATVAARVNR